MGPKRQIGRSRCSESARFSDGGDTALARGIGRGRVEHGSDKAEDGRDVDDSPAPVTPHRARDWKRLRDAGVEFIEDPTDYGTVRIATLKNRPTDKNWSRTTNFVSRSGPKCRSALP
jgi:hypothetical protein